MKRTLLAIVLATSLGGLLTPMAQAATVDPKGMVMHFYDEIMTQNKLDMADKYIAMNAIDHDPMMDPKMSTLDNFKSMMKMMHAGFPDLKITVQDVIIEGDKVAVRYRMTGTNKGDFMGMKATGKTVDLEGVDIMRIADGKFVEHWGYMDSMIMMQQLGMMH
ncbi:MAG: ester cyclase [Candidatus Sericytochromatia bacterium]